MKRTSLLVAVGVTVLLALVVGAALATPPKDATTTLITRATLGEFEAHNDGIKMASERRSADLAIAKVVIEPGGSTGWHHHPGVGLAAVKSGAVTFYDEDCEKSVYKAGEGFLESHHPMLVRNKTNSKAVFYAVFIIPTSTTEEGLRIDDPKPKECNVK
jgi:quercetin dioxygenase-like cupin family protein